MRATGKAMWLVLELIKVTQKITHRVVLGNSLQRPNLNPKEFLLVVEQGFLFADTGC